MDRTLKKYLQSPSYNVLTKSSFSKALPKSKVNVFFTVEGCHSLVDRPNFCDAANKYSPTEILGNLDKVQEKALNPNDQAVVWLETIKFIFNTGKTEGNKKIFRIEPTLSKHLIQNPNSLY